MDAFEHAWRAEYERPLPVDHTYRSGPRDPTVPAWVGLQARAHIGVFDGPIHAPRLLEYRRTEWAVFKKQVRQALMRFGIAKISAGGTLNRSVDDTGGTSRSLRLYGPSASAANLFNVTDVYDDTEVQVAVGTDNVAPTEDDDTIGAEVLSLVASIAKSTASFETVRIRATATGAYGGANTTIKEAVLRTAWNLDGVTRPRFQLDRSTYADLPLNNGNILHIQYDLVV